MSEKTRIIKLNEERLDNLCCRPVYLACGLGLVFAAFLAFYGGTRGQTVKVWFSALGVVVLLWLGAYLMSRGSETHSRITRIAIIVGILMLGILVRILIYDFYKTLPVSDFFHPHRAYGVRHSPDVFVEAFQAYYQRFPTWYSYYRYITFVYDTFGKSLDTVVYLNMFWYVIAACFIYKAARLFWRFRIALFALLLFSFSPFLVVWTCVTTPDHLSLAFSSVMLYFFGKMYKAREDAKIRSMVIYGGLAMLTAAFCQFFKPIAIIYGMAFLCVELFSRLAAPVLSRKWKLAFSRVHLILWLTAISIFFISLSSTNTLLHSKVEKNVRAPVVDSTWLYIAWGTWVTNGAYNPRPVNGRYDALLKEHPESMDQVMEKLREEALAQIRQNLRYMPVVLWTKANLLFGDDQAAHGWASRKTADDRGETLALFYATTQGVPTFFSALALLGAGFAALRQLRARGVNEFFLLLLFMVCGYFAMFALVGVQSRYKIIVLPQLAILSAYGTATLCRWIGLAIGRR